METIKVKLEEFVNAKNGDILIYNNGHWERTTFNELNKQNEARLNELEKLRGEFKMLAENNKHFTLYAKSHFMVVYNLLIGKIQLGEIDCQDDEILNLDDMVLNGSISVKDALEKHPYLKETFAKLYLGKEDIVTFPQV